MDNLRDHLKGSVGVSCSSPEAHTATSGDVMKTDRTIVLQVVLSQEQLEPNPAGLLVQLKLNKAKSGSGRLDSITGIRSSEERRRDGQD